jgi:type VI secretion system protein ImpA
LTDSSAVAGTTYDLHGWLDPLAQADSPCGPDLEYENEFLELIRGAQGKPESQFAAAEPPNWPFVRERAESLMERTRDLRIAVYWTRANVHLQGFAALAPGLKLIDELLTTFWDGLHPLPDPDDGDQYPRVNALSLLAHQEGLCGDVRQCALFSLRGSGVIRYRAVSIAFGQSVARADEAAYGKEQLAQMVASAVQENPAIVNEWQSVLHQARALEATLKEKFDPASAPDLKPLIDMVKLVHGLLPASASVPEAGAQAGGSADGAAEPALAAAGLGGIRSRDDVLRALDMICEYLDRVEPSNPAQLLLRRARRLINRDFLQLVKELAPEALNEAARVLGVDPDSVNLQNGA